ncbi:Cys-tRNA(Pro) deacylase [Marinimicrococcus flavescens]|uniref:Cys-tRNA(Pro)/Cys-tRNA(Cys) deacylase n=1 Tax=Marinimicrococcus flavescens TaxID=3031815 RepID=A0AAP4D7P4_9PROT|nr:Cys-tRNA(Pro) deacylase [Marinimicrococcus flavescens]
MAKATAGGTPAVRFLEAQGTAFTLHEYDFEAAPGAIGLKAAAALGVEPARMLKTLMAVLDGGEMVAALVPVDRELDLKALAAAAGAKRAAMAEVKAAERATGYVKGGISPFAQRRHARTFLDASATAHPTVIVNGGRRGLQIELTPAALRELTAAEVGEIGR